MTRLATTLSSFLLLPPASVSSPSPRRAPAAAHQGVRHPGGRVAVHDEGAGLVLGVALLGDERGHLGGVAALQGPSAPRIIQPAAARSGPATAANAMRAATGCRQPKLCSATRERAPSAPSTAAARRAMP